KFRQHAERIAIGRVHALTEARPIRVHLARHRNRLDARRAASNLLHRAMRRNDRPELSVGLYQEARAAIERSPHERLVRRFVRLVLLARRFFVRIFGHASSLGDDGCSVKPQAPAESATELARSLLPPSSPFALARVRPKRLGGRTAMLKTSA